MNINLLYVEGISRIDTPYFPNITDQEQYFDSKIEITVNTTFYPPHYQNKIRFGSDDLDFNTICNYCYFEYLNKRYYYFIDGIEYINENLIELSITMDYVQTYMFNIEIASGVIERRFISRFETLPDDPSDLAINRTYIRENVSGGEFDIISQEDKTQDLWIVVKSSKRITNMGQDGAITYADTIASSSLYDKDNNRYNVPYFFYFGKIGALNIVNTDSQIILIGTSSLAPLLNKNETIEIFIVPFNPIPEYCSVSGNNMILDGSSLRSTERFDSTLFFMGLIAIENINPLYPLAPYTSIFYTGGRYYIHNDNFEYDIFTNDILRINTLVGTPFNYRYFPQLIDENYYRFEYGNYTTNITFPLHYLQNNKLIFNTVSVPTSGLFGFNIALNNNDLMTKYSSLDINSDMALYDLANSPWQNYIASNKGRYASVGMRLGLNIAKQFIPTINVASYAKDKIASIMSLPSRKLYDRRFKVPTIKQKHQNVIDRMNRNITDAETNAINDALLSSFNQGESDIESALNAYYQPPSPKQLQTIDSTIGLGYIKPYFKIYRVRDYFQCANYYHRNGYKVDLYLRSYIPITNNIFRRVQNRYYFNILKMSSCEVHLKNVIEDTDTSSNIEDRLKDGIRLWNVLNDGVSMCDYQYDNVELEYL